MPVYYDTQGGSFAVASEFCGECEEPLYDTGCDAPGCLGYRCVNCGTGCDIDIAPEDGTCAGRVASESDEEYTERVNAERAAFGLSPLAAGTETADA
jgi:hypothetical protein